MEQIESKNIGSNRYIALKTNIYCLKYKRRYRRTLALKTIPLSTTNENNNE